MHKMSGSLWWNDWSALRTEVPFAGEAHSDIIYV